MLVTKSTPRSTLRVLFATALQHSCAQPSGSQILLVFVRPCQPCPKQHLGNAENAKERVFSLRKRLICSNQALTKRWFAKGEEYNTSSHVLLLGCSSPTPSPHPPFPSLAPHAPPPRAHKRNTQPHATPWQRNLNENNSLRTICRNSERVWRPQISGKDRLATREKAWL